jgi:hypothetical protein
MATTKEELVVLCDRVFERHREEKWQEALAVYDELLSADEALIMGVVSAEDEETLALLTRAWARIMLAAREIGSGVDHLQDIMADFEQVVGLKSPLLQSIVMDAASPVEALEQFHGRYGMANSDVVDGILHKFFPPSPPAVHALLQRCHELGVALSPVVEERLLKLYTKRMKTEDPEAVFNEMIVDRVPRSCVTYNMVLNKAELTGVQTHEELFEQMLGEGVKPLASTYRIILKNARVSREHVAMFRRRIAGATEPEHSLVQQLQRIASHVDEQSQAAAEKIFSRLELEGMVPDKEVFNLMILCSREHPDTAEGWYRRMLARDITPCTLTFSNLIAVFDDHPSHVGRVDEWTRAMTERGLSGEWSKRALEGYVRGGKRAKAQQCLVLVLESDCQNSAVFNSAIRLGPFDWGLGCLGCCIATGTEITQQMKHALRALVHDDTADMYMAALNDCDFEPQRILTDDVLMRPARGSHPSVQDCMRFMMREAQAPQKLRDDIAARFTYALENAKQGVL